MPGGTARRRAAAFSLIELVIVVAILGILAAIAVPRLSRGAAGATSAQLKSDLAILRSSLELYYAEHNNVYPTVANWNNQMVAQYSDELGNTNVTKTPPFIYGPYLKATPILRVGTEKGSNTVDASASSGVAWVYDETTGQISANTGLLKDDTGVLYSTY